MKKNKVIYLIVLGIILGLIVLGIIAFCITRSESFILTFYMYRNIQYNGVDYYMAGDQWVSLDQSFEDLPVYLVDKKGKVLYENVYYAWGYEGDDERIYLFFNGAVYTREKSLVSKLFDEKYLSPAET